MRTFLAVLLGAAALITAMPTVEARDGCGRGMYFDGYACRPQGGYGGGGYYGGGGPGYNEGYYRRRPYVPDQTGASCVPNRDPRWPCQCSNWTVQGGVCKPYRGG